MFNQFSLFDKQLAWFAEKLFLILLGAYLVLGALRTTSLEYSTPPFFTAAIVVGLLVIIGVKFSLLHMYSVKEAALYFAIFAMVLVVVLRNHHDTLMMLFLLVIASKGVEFRKIIVVHFIAVVEVLLFSAVLSQTGVSPDFGVSYSGTALNTFGVCNTTDFASYILFLVLGYTFLRDSQITFAELALFIAVDVWLYRQTQARTAFAALLLFCLAIFLYKLVLHHPINITKLKVAPLGIVLMPFLSFLILVPSYLYSNQNALMILLNRIFSNRITLSHVGLERYGISLLGNAVVEHGFGFGAQPYALGEYFFLDSSYMRLFLIDGLLIYIAVMLLYSFIYKKLLLKKNIVGIIIFFVLAINCLTEQHLLEPWYNPFTFIFLGSSLPQQERKCMKVNDIPVLLKRSKFHFLLAVGVFVTLLLSINFHTDGSTVTPGNYSIYQARLASDVLGFDADYPNQVFVVKTDRNATSPQEWFTLVFLESGNYYIEDFSGKRLTLQNETVRLEDPSTIDAETQQWKIRRWKNSLYFTITNVKTGLSLYSQDLGPLQCYYYDNEDEAFFLFGVTPATA